MIVEAKPLHKKKKRLAKQRSNQKENEAESNYIKEFLVYNRYKEMKRKAMELKEKEWQAELDMAMANSEVRPVSINRGRVTPIESSATSSGRDNESIDFIDRTPSPKLVG